jgi:hypothetical protein
MRFGRQPAFALHGDDLYVAEWTNPNSEQRDYRSRVARPIRMSP